MKIYIIFIYIHSYVFEVVLFKYCSIYDFPLLVLKVKRCEEEERVAVQTLPTYTLTSTYLSTIYVCLAISITDESHAKTTKRLKLRWILPKELDHWCNAITDGLKIGAQRNACLRNCHKYSFRFDYQRIRKLFASAIECLRAHC